MPDPKTCSASFGNIDWTKVWRTNAWSADERALVLKLRAMISRFEDTRDLRLMGAYHAGQDPELDKAVVFVPKIYQGMTQLLGAPSEDAFKELAAAMQAG